MIKCFTSVLIFAFVSICAVNAQVVPAPKKPTSNLIPVDGGGGGGGGPVVPGCGSLTIFPSISSNFVEIHGNTANVTVWWGNNGATNYFLVSSSGSCSVQPGNVINGAGPISGLSSCTINGIPLGTSPQFTVEATRECVDGFGDLNTDERDSDPITVTLPPAPPAVLTPSAVTATSFSAGWSASTGASSYRLDVSTDGFSTFVSGFNNLTVNGTSQSVTGLSSGTAYSYRIRAVNGAGTSANSTSVTQTTIPGAPVLTAATSVATNSFTVNWNAVTGASSYRLDVSPDGFSTFVSGFNNLTVNATSQSVTGLTSGTTYSFRVRAVGTAGTSANSTSSSQMALLATPVTTTPSSVTTNSFTIGWNAIANATSYRLDVSADGFSTFVTGFNNLTVAGTSQSVTGLTPGVTYSYRVRAANSGGTSPNSTSGTQVTIPGAPVLTAATSVATNSFTVNWNAVTGANSYQLDVSADGFSTFVSGFNNLTVNATSQSVTGLTSGTTYSFRVRAVGTAGTSANSTSSSQMALLATPVTTTPSSVTTNSFTIGWNAIANATSYRLDVSADGFSTFVTGFNNLTVAGTSQSVTGLTPGVTYSYRVRAANSGGTSPNSTSGTQATIPNAPVLTTMTSVTTSSFTINWSAVTGANSYRLDVSTDGFSTFITGFNNLTVNGTSQSVTGLTSGTAYSFRVRAVGTAGTSANSTSSSQIPFPTTPVTTTPSSVTTNSFTIGWNAAVGASGYQLDVSADGFSTFVTGFNNLTVTGTSQSVTGLSPGVTYSYRVRSFNGGGISSNSTPGTQATIPNAPVLTATTSVTASSFTVNWNTVTGASSYRLDVSTDGFSTFVSGFNNLTVNATSQSVTGVTSGMNYSFRVRAVGTAGTSANSTLGTQSTIPGAPVFAATTSITTTSFTANWGAVTGASSYLLDVSTSNSFTTGNILTGTSVGGTSKNVTGLTAGTVYFFRVLAVGAGGLSPYSTVKSVTTIPPTPTGVTFLSPTLNSFTAIWQPVTGVVSNYFIDLATNAGFNPILLLGLPAGTAGQKNVTDLTNGTTYYFRVRATNAGGVSISDTVAVTLPAIPVPKDLLTSSITSTSFKLFWSPAGGATSYEANLSADSTFANVTTSNVTTDSTIFTGLSVAKPYYCRVRALGAGGSSAWSQRLTVVTAPVITPMNTFPHSFTVTCTDAGAQTNYLYEVSKNLDFSSFVDPFQGTKPLSSSTFITYSLDSGQVYYTRARILSNNTVSGYSNILTMQFQPDPNTILRTGPGDDGQMPFSFNILPPSPEAAALAKYVDIPVSLYSGTPSVSIPFYEVKERGLTLPIALSYHGGGNKVEQVATRTGLGWSLNAGGVVTRVMRGWPDEHPRGFLSLRQRFSKVSDIITLSNDSETKFETFNSLADNCSDGEPDLFYFNFGGYAGSFMFDWDGNIKILSGNSIKIQPLDHPAGDFFTGWQITVDDGSVYTFSVQESTELVPNPLPTVADCNFFLEMANKTMPQSWFLSRVTSADGLGGIQFEYENYTQYTETDVKQTDVFDLMKFQNAQPLNVERFKAQTIYRGVNLKRIATTSGQTIVDFVHASQSRSDIFSDEASNAAINDNFPLGQIKVSNQGGKQIVHWDLGYSYATGRLTLESVTESTGAVAKSPYKFSYTGGQLPPTNSTEIDHWGFHNGNRGPLLPTTFVHIPFTPLNELTEIPGGSRSPSSTLVLDGMLKEITYPTGGKDLLTFESHDYSFQQSEELLVTDSVQRVARAEAATSPSAPTDISSTFQLNQMTDVHITYNFTFADAILDEEDPDHAHTHTGGGVKNPAVRLHDNTRNTDLIYLVPSINSEHFGDGSETQRLREGSYTITAIGYNNVQFEDPVDGHLRSDGLNSASISVRWEEAVGPPRADVRIGGGVRIKEIARSFNNGNPDKITHYNYSMVEGGQVKSSGSLLELAQIYEIYMQYAFPIDNAPNSNAYRLEDRYLRFARNKAVLGTTQGSHVGYRQVTVLEGASGENGKSIYHFDSPREVTDFESLEIPFPPAQSLDFERGLLLDQTQFNASGDTVRFVKNTYDFTNHTLDIQALKVGWLYPGPVATGAGESLMARYAPGPYTNTLGFSRLTQTRERLVYSNAPSFETVTSYTYNENTHKQLIQTSMINSKGESMVTAQKFPLDYSSPSAPISLLQAAHMDNIPVEMVTWKNGTGSQVSLLGGMKTDFVIDHSGISALPQTKYSAKIADPVVTSDPYGTASTLYEPRLVIGSYDNFNNPLQSSKPDGKKTGYQWGYTNTLLVAAADNTSSLNMFYEGFEEDGSASGSDQKTGKKSKPLTMGTYSIPRLPVSNGDYILSYWVKDGANPWMYKEKQFNNYTTGLPIATDVVNNGFLDEVRLYPKGALMTTYTYEPLVGITSITDPANETIYFEYDDFNRLAFKRDLNHNIIAAYEYGINTDVPFQIPPPTLASIAPVASEIGSTVVISGTNFSSIPAENVVTFNGVAAVIASATSTQLTVTVPAGATTGKVVITVNGVAITSSSDFAVLPPFAITSLNPVSGVAGSSLIINGTGFNSTPTNNVVTLNGTAATVTAVSPSQLTVVVPTGATTGTISVTTDGRTRTSATTFEVLKDVPHSGLVAFYPLAGNATDVTGNNLHGTVFGGALPAADRFGNSAGALRFDGVDDFVDFGNPQLLQLSNSFSVSGWVYFDSSPTSGSVPLIQKMHFNDYGNADNGYAINLAFSGGSTGLAADMRSNGNSSMPFFGGQNLQAGTWIFFTMVIDGPAFRTYYNGTPTGNSPGSSNLVTNGTLANLVMGNSHQFTGRLDDVGIYNRALTNDEVTQLYQQTYSKANFVQPLSMNTLFAPSSGAPNSNFTITGTGFSTVANIVKINGVQAVVTIATPTQLTIKVPTGTQTGKVSVTVDGTTITSTQDFVVINPPTVTSFSPAQGAVGSTMTITGTNFIPDATAGSTKNIVVRAKGTSGTENLQLEVNGTVVSTWFLTTNWVNFTATTTLAGDIKVRFTNDDTGRDVQVDYLSINGAVRQAEDQAINSGFFANGACGGAGYSELIQCSGYIDFGLSDNVVKINGAVATITSATSTQITAIVPAAATAGQVSVTNNLGAITATSTNSFVVNPTIASFTPNHGATGTTVTINGSNFSTTAASNTVKFNGVTAVVTAATATQLTVTVPAGVTAGKITVTTNGATVTSTTNFTLNPTITSFSPGQGGIGSTVTITGTNFVTVPGGGSTITVHAKGRGMEDGESIRLDVNDTPVATWTLTSVMQDYTATTTLNGNIKVYFTNDDGGRDAQIDYIIVNGILRQAEDQPINTGVRVGGVCGGGSNSEFLQCNGYIDFGNITADNVVKFNGTVASVTSVTATQLTAVIPATGTTGVISVTINGATATSGTTFTVTTPTITSVSPVAALVGSTVTITGTNFSTTLANNVVKFNGVSATVTAATATQLTVTVPTTATTGLLSVTVNGTTGTTASNFEILIDIPRNGLVAFYPLSGNASDASGHNLNGTIFGGAVAGSDRFGKASGSMQFDGIDDYISMGNPTLLQISNTITVSGWINITAFKSPQGPGTIANVISKLYNDPSQGNNPTQGWTLSQNFTGGDNPSPTFAEATYSSVGTNITSFTSNYVGNTIPTNNWIFFTMVITNDTFSFYQNGELINSFGVEFEERPILRDGSVGDLIISSQPAFSFSGRIDDVAIYNRALSQGEITQLYQQTISKY